MGLYAETTGLGVGRSSEGLGRASVTANSSPACIALVKVKLIEVFPVRIDLRTGRESCLGPAGADRIIRR